MEINNFKNNKYNSKKKNEIKLAKILKSKKIILSNQIFHGK
jgi:hypothetical protein